jgi:cell division septation protein DedD
MRVARGVVIFVSGVLLACLAACSHEARDWHSAQAANTIEAYQQFLSQHPQGAHTADAQTLIAELTETRDWQRASTTDTADAYRQFLAQHPQGKNAQEARIRLENFGLNASASTGAPAATAVPGVSPPATAPVTPAPAPKTASVPPAAAPAPGPSGGQYAVQLGAFSSHAKAQAQWQRLSAHFAHEFNGSTPDIERGKSGGHHVFRLKVKGLTEAHAKSICAALRKHSQACIVGHPA